MLVANDTAPVQFLNDTVADNAGISLAITNPYVGLVIRNTVISGSAASMACWSRGGPANKVVLDHDDFSGFTPPPACGSLLDRPR